MECKVTDIAGITMALGNSTVSAISGQGTHTFTSVVKDYLINGKAGTTTVQTTANFPTLDDVTGVAMVGLALKNTGTVVVLGVQLGAAVMVAAQGSVETIDAAGNFLASSPPKFPALKDNFCPLAYIIIKADSTLAAPFVVGTSLWTQTGVTEVIVNIGALPDRPQVA